jgi:hypothetical protein
MQSEQQQAARQEYDQQKERRATLTNLTLQTTESQTPTPTQEENDLLKLGLMHPDDKADPAAPEMPAAAAQQAYLASGEGRLEAVTPARRTQVSTRETPPAQPAPRPTPEQRPADRNVPRPADKS